MSKEQDWQLANWLDGKSEHNHVDDECCPDFSCCRPELLAPEHERKAFLASNEKGRIEFLMGFLGRAMATYEQETKIHIAGDSGEEH